MRNVEVHWTQRHTFRNVVCWWQCAFQWRCSWVGHSKWMAQLGMTRQDTRSGMRRKLHSPYSNKAWEQRKKEGWLYGNPRTAAVRDTPGRIKFASLSLLDVAPLLFCQKFCPLNTPTSPCSIITFFLFLGLNSEIQMTKWRRCSTWRSGWG